MKSNHNIALIIPTRWNSERLPGKVLMDINGKPNLERIIERALYSHFIKKVILCISVDDSKELLEWYTSKEHPNVFIHLGKRNLIELCLEAARKYDVDIIADTSACCSLFDPFMADVLIESLLNYEADYSANCIVRSFPDGFDIQVYTREIYERVFNQSIHCNPKWTGWNIWHCREDLFPKPRILNWQAPVDYYYPQWRLTLDTPEDHKVITAIYQYFSGICFRYHEVIEYLKENPDWLESNRNIISTKLEKEIVK